MCYILNQKYYEDQIISRAKYENHKYYYEVPKKLIVERSDATYVFEYSTNQIKDVLPVFKLIKEI